MHVRVLLSRYRAYTPCPDCQGKRFQPEALLYRVPAAPLRKAEVGNLASREFPFPMTNERGEGEGRPEQGAAAKTNLSPQPSPHSSLAGRGGDAQPPSGYA